MTNAAAPTDIAARHRAVAATFADRVAGAEKAGTWNNPSPVDGWSARDVVNHLIVWLPGLLASGSDVQLAEVSPVALDPVVAWADRSAAVQRVLDDPQQAEAAYVSPMFGELTVAQLIDRFYTTDVLMHTWDLARATGQPDRLDEDLAREVYAGMKTMEDLIRNSGQFGDQQPVPPDADATDELIAFIGRDPRWSAPGA